MLKFPDDAIFNLPNYCSQLQMVATFGDATVFEIYFLQFLRFTTIVVGSLPSRFYYPVDPYVLR